MPTSLNHRGATVWLTGLPCSGKSTIATALERWLRERGYKAEVLDGDQVRAHLSKGLGFSKEDRDTNIRRIGFVCQLLSRNGVIAIAAAISPYRAVREEVKSMIGADFNEIYIDCPVEVCMQRDVKGHYKKALAGEIHGFTGVDDLYEAPPAPDLVLRTDQEPVEQSLSRLVRHLRARGYVRD